MIPYAVSFELFNGHCDLCQHILKSRPMYIIKIPGIDTKQVRYWCNVCASRHEKYIILKVITKN